VLAEAAVQAVAAQAVVQAAALVQAVPEQAVRVRVQVQVQVVRAPVAVVLAAEATHQARRSVAAEIKWTRASTRRRSRVDGWYGALRIEGRRHRSTSTNRRAVGPLSATPPNERPRSCTPTKRQTSGKLAQLRVSGAA
jgi:hypothetical protein